jgi:hypothetical protein
MNNEIAKLVPTKSDADRAAEHRERVIAVLKEICPVLDAARADGFEVSFSLQPDFMNKTAIAQLAIVKRF